MESRILIESVSPNDTAEAVVEEADGCCYLYLRFVPEAERPVASCWVRNLAPAPRMLDVERMKSGRAPLLPASACRHAGGAPPLDSTSLEIVWLEEGDAAALLENGEILAVVPSWSGLGGFTGYARDCVEETALAWPLGSPSTNALFKRVERAQAWWREWERGDPWTPVQQGTIAALEDALGPHTNYYAIDGTEWPPRALLRFRQAGSVPLVTCGVALRPQPGVEQSTDDPAPRRRIELAMAVEEGVFARHGERLLRYISAQSRLPWVHYTWLGEGHTIPCDAFSEADPRTPWSAVVLTATPAGAPHVQLPALRDDPVNLLWMLPITATERTYAVEAGSAQLLERLSRAGAGWCHGERRPT